MTENKPTKRKIIAVTNQKGGVGKTTTAVNLAASLANAKRKTLLIDLDPQGNASSGLGVDRNTSSTIYDVLIGRKQLAEAIQKTELEGLHVIPANPNLIGAEVELINAISREKKLKQALKSLDDGFEFIFFDCPPSLGLLTINAFTASDSIIIPTQCEYYALEGLGQLLNTFQIVKEDLNQDLDIEGVLLTMFDPRNKLTHEVVKELKSHFPEKLFATAIPRNVKLSESPSFGKPALLYDPESKGCLAYLNLAKEILEKNDLDIKGFEKVDAVEVITNEPVDVKEEIDQVVEALGETSEETIQESPAVETDPTYSEPQANLDDEATEKVSAEEVARMTAEANFENETEDKKQETSKDTPTTTEHRVADVERVEQVPAETVRLNQELESTTEG